MHVSTDLNDLFQDIMQSARIARTFAWSLFAFLHWCLWFNSRNRLWFWCALAYTFAAIAGLEAIFGQELQLHGTLWDRQALQPVWIYGIVVCILRASWILCLSIFFKRSGVFKDG